MNEVPTFRNEKCAGLGADDYGPRSQCVPRVRVGTFNGKSMIYTSCGEIAENAGHMEAYLSIPSVEPENVLAGHPGVCKLDKKCLRDLNEAGELNVEVVR